MTWTEFKISQSVTDTECNICSLATPFGTFRIRRNQFTDVYFTYFRNDRYEDKNTLEETKKYISELIDSKNESYKSWLSKYEEIR